MLRVVQFDAAPRNGHSGVAAGRSNAASSYGGTAENMMCHYAILDAAGDAEATVWLEPVTDQQYTTAHAAAGLAG